MDSRVEILLVDDEARNLDALEAILAGPEYDLLRAQDADTALRLLLAHEVAAIVMDIKMPEVSGFELARIIKSTKRFRETPIVFLTAYMVDDRDIVAGYGAGGVDYLTKPVNSEILRHKVAVFADLFRKSRQLASLNAELAALNEKLEERVRERTDELQKSEAALRAAADQKDVFLAVLAHELRNPLAPLRTGLDLLLRLRAETTPAVTRTIESMNRQLDHMVRLINDLLDVSRISRGSFDLKRENVELAPVVQTTVDAVREWFEKRRQNLSVEVDSGIFAHADPMRFAQILTNLLHNATKFTPEGGFVQVQLVKQGDAAEVRVIDSGVGIRSDQLEHVFQLFARIRRSATMTESGLGIGLALARRLAEMHGGSLEVSSDGEGCGTTFSLRLPALVRVEAAESVERKASTPGKAAEPLGIVVVEDNEDVADVLAEWLEELGHSVTIARTGKTGIDAIQERRPDLVICDLGLPELDGLNVCRRVRLLLGEEKPTMVALTGWGRDDNLKASRDAGFDFHLVKPVAPDALDTLLRNVSQARESLTSVQSVRDSESPP